MNAKKTIALALAAALGLSMSAAYADHDRGREYRHEYRDGRDYRHERYEHARHGEFIRRDYWPRRYVVERPVYVSPPVVYAPAMPPVLDIVIPIRF